MDKIYYQPNHLWKGQKAIKKLKELSKENQKQLSNGCQSKNFGNNIYLLQNTSIDLITR